MHFINTFFRPDDMSSWEDLGEDEDVKKGRLSSNSINFDDNDIIVKRNDGLSGTDKGSPNRIRQDDDIIVKRNDGLSGTDKGSPNRIIQDSAESESGAEYPALNQKKTGKPKIEGKHLNMK